MNKVVHVSHHLCMQYLYVLPCIYVWRLTSSLTLLLEGLLGQCPSNPWGYCDPPCLSFYTPVLDVRITRNCCQEEYLWCMQAPRESEIQQASQGQLPLVHYLLHSLTVFPSAGIQSAQYFHLSTFDDLVCIQHYCCCQMMMMFFCKVPTPHHTGGKSGIGCATGE